MSEPGFKFNSDFLYHGNSTLGGASPSPPGDIFQCREIVLLLILRHSVGGVCSHYKMAKMSIVSSLKRPVREHILRQCLLSIDVQFCLSIFMERTSFAFVHPLFRQLWQWEKSLLFWFRTCFLGVSVCWHPEKQDNSSKWPSALCVTSLLLASCSVVSDSLWPHGL